MTITSLLTGTNKAHGGTSHAIPNKKSKKKEDRWISFLYHFSIKHIIKLNIF